MSDVRRRDAAREGGLAEAADDRSTSWRGVLDVDAAPARRARAAEPGDARRRSSTHAAWLPHREPRRALRARLPGARRRALARAHGVAPRGDAATRAGRAARGARLPVATRRGRVMSAVPTCPTIDDIVAARARRGPRRRRRERFVAPAPARPTCSTRDVTGSLLVARTRASRARSSRARPCVVVRAAGRRSASTTTLVGGRRAVEPVEVLPARRRGRARRGRARRSPRSRGPRASVLAGERTALDFLMVLSGIATEAARGGRRPRARRSRCATRARRCPGCARSRSTRSRVGGGTNHRDGPLRHGARQGQPHRAPRAASRAAVERARASASRPRASRSRPTRVEQAVEAVAAGADIVLLDNMDDATLAAAVAAVRAATPPGRTCLTEASGGDHARAAARARPPPGSTACSASALTLAAPARLRARRECGLSGDDPGPLTGIAWIDALLGVLGASGLPGRVPRRAAREPLHRRQLHAGGDRRHGASRSWRAATRELSIRRSCGSSRCSGTMAGSNISYWIGHRGGRPLLDRVARRFPRLSQGGSPTPRSTSRSTAPRRSSSRGSPRASRTWCRRLAGVDADARCESSRPTPLLSALVYTTGPRRHRLLLRRPTWTSSSRGRSGRAYWALAVVGGPGRRVRRVPDLAPAPDRRAARRARTRRGAVGGHPRDARGEPDGGSGPAEGRDES